MNIGGDGYLHRDVSIGNVLRLTKPVEHPAFSTRSLELFKSYRRPTAEEPEIEECVATAVNNPPAEGDVKPNVGYLDSPHEHRKRFRSRDDVGTGGSIPKMPMTDEDMVTQRDAALPGADVMRSEKIGHALGDDEFWTTLRSTLAHDDNLVKVADAAERLETAPRTLVVSTTCQAILINGDMDARLQTYFTSAAHVGIISVSSGASV